MTIFYKLSRWIPYGTSLFIKISVRARAREFSIYSAMVLKMYSLKLVPFYTKRISKGAERKKETATGAQDSGISLRAAQEINFPESKCQRWLKKVSVRAR